MLGAFHPLSISMKQLNEIRPETLWKKENCSDISMHKDVNSILICIINVVLIPLLLTFSFPTLFLCFPCWFWASKCRLGVTKTQKFALVSIKAANWDHQLLSDFCFNWRTFSRRFKLLWSCGPNQVWTNQNSESLYLNFQLQYYVYLVVLLRIKYFVSKLMKFSKKRKKKLISTNFPYWF